MSAGKLSFPVVALGAASAFALFSLFRPRGASAAPMTGPAPVHEPTPSTGFTFGRPVPSNVRAIATSGWSRPRGDRLHRALDIPLPTGTPILAIDDGIVVRVRHTDVNEAGKWVGVRHPSGVVSRYLHLSKAGVELGQVVRRGDVVGLSGNSGNSRNPHLHLDLRVPAEMLSTIERLVGKPRSGWGPAMSGFGHSIPGEPWIPVDGYRRDLRRDAEAEGIPLLYPDAPRNGSLEYRPVGKRGEPYPEWLRRLRGSSGVYVIRERDGDGDPVIVYVGESHANRLYETLTRHFQEWRRWKSFWKNQYSEGHDPGLTYRRDRVEVAVKVTTPSKAIDEEARLIRRLRPRDNLLGQLELEEAPF